METLEVNCRGACRRRVQGGCAAARPAGLPLARLVVLSLTLCRVAITPLGAAAADRLAREIDAVLADGGLGNAKVGVSVVAPASGRVLYSRNNMDEMIVASNQKIVTAAVALRELGPDYEIRVFPKEKNLFQLLAEAFGGEKEDEFVSLRPPRFALGSSLTQAPNVAAALEALSTLEPAKARALENFLIQVELLSSEGVLMVDTNLATWCR